jgi:serine/threonine protein kinase
MKGSAIVFDLVEGSSLAEKIKQGAMSWQSSARIVAEVAENLQFAHNKGFIHRDIKPANILLDERGSPVLADFGIAITECELRHETLTSVGTLAYMAPEQLQVGRLVDARTDVYAPGVVLYELLTGRLPFVTPTLSGLRAEILASEPPSPR